MGTWDDGLFDNDAALDKLADFIDTVQLERSPTHLAVGIGIHLWLAPARVEGDPEEYEELIRAHSSWVSGYPSDVRQALERFVADPAAAAAGDSRDDDISAVVGAYCDGPFNAVLLQCEGATAVMEELADRCREHLDKLADSPSRDLYGTARDWAALGLLVVLTQLDVGNDTEHIQRWEAAFDRADGLTAEEREFWDGYVARGKAAFRLLRGQAKGVSTSD